MPSLIIKPVFLYALFQNGRYQSVKLHTVNLTDYNQLRKGVFFHRNCIMLFVRTQVTHTDIKCVRNFTERS